jgi:hypothetical protein
MYKEMEHKKIIISGKVEPKENEELKLLMLESRMNNLEEENKILKERNELLMSRLKKTEAVCKFYIEEEKQKHYGWNKSGIVFDD